MTVRIKNNVLREFLHKALFEMDYVQYGMFDRPGPHEKEGASGNAEPVETTVPAQVPVKPVEIMTSQVVSDRPPVEDDEYVPENPEELSRAVKALALGVPADNVSRVYLGFKRMVSSTPEGSSEQANTTNKMTQAEALRKAITLILKEGRWSEDDPRFFHDEESELADEEPEPVNDEPEGAGLEQLASEFGYAGASGVRQDIERMLQRMKYLSEKMGKGEMEALQDFAAQEFIDLMRDGEYIDDEDAVELQQNTSVVKKLESFRFFFISGILMPAYNEIKRNARKKVEDLIAALNLPAEMNQSILNQALGEVPKDLDKLAKKLQKVAAESGVNDPAEIAGMVNGLKAGFANMQKASELEGGLSDLAKERWSRQSKGRRQQALAQALQSTTEWHASEGKSEEP